MNAGGVPSKFGSPFRLIIIIICTGNLVVVHKLTPSLTTRAQNSLKDIFSDGLVPSYFL